MERTKKAMTMAGLTAASSVIEMVVASALQMAG
jgi:hypothetical protein